MAVSPALEVISHLMKASLFPKEKPPTFESSVDLFAWLSRWQKLHYKFHAIIVQPGFSIAKAEPSHLELFAATQSLLMDTWGMTLRILASP